MQYKSILVQVSEPDLSKWEAWRPHDVARMLTGVGAPWYIAAGWAIDLFLGGEYREHDDLEIAVPRERANEVVGFFEGFEFRPVGSHQLWVADPTTGAWKLDIMSEPSDGETWVFRRDERIRLPYHEVIEWTSDGIPYGRPEIILLFKAKQERDKDDADFAAALPHMGRDRRRWLADALELVHPGHHWLAQLAH